MLNRRSFFKQVLVSVAGIVGILLSKLDKSKQTKNASSYSQWPDAVVSMCQFKGRLFVATKSAVYELDGHRGYKEINIDRKLCKT